MNLRSILGILRTTRLRPPGYVLFIMVFAVVMVFCGIRVTEAATLEEDDGLKKRAAKIERCKKEGGIPSINFGWTIVCHDPRAVRWAE